MKITIDATSLLQKTATGGPKYTRNLIQALAKVDKENIYNLLFYTSSKERRKNLLNKKRDFNHKNFKIKTLNFPQYGLEILWNKFNVKFPPIEFFIGKTDVFHAPGYRTPVTKKAKLITTIYDLTRLKLKTIMPCWVVEHFLSIVKPAIERSDKIITISENTKKDLIEIFNLPAKKIEVIYCGVSPNFAPIEDKKIIRDILTRYNISQPYVLCVATSLGKNKNLETLIRSFKVLKDKHRVNHRLVIVGRKSEEYEILLRLASELGIDDRVVFTGEVLEDELICIYNGADVFVFPSLYEGFGLPPLEAMACGLPVVVANTSSLPEVVKDAGILVEPCDVEQIAESIYKIISDSEFKNNLIKKSLERAKAFSWEKCAKETIQVYNEISNV